MSTSSSQSEEHPSTCSTTITELDPGVGVQDTTLLGFHSGSDRLCRAKKSTMESTFHNRIRARCSNEGANDVTSPGASCFFDICDTFGEIDKVWLVRSRVAEEVLPKASSLWCCGALTGADEAEENEGGIRDWGCSTWYCFTRKLAGGDAFPS